MDMIHDIPVEHHFYIDEDCHRSFVKDAIFKRKKTKYKVLKQFCFNIPEELTITLIYVNIYRKYLVYVSTPCDEYEVDMDSSQEEIAGFIKKYTPEPLENAREYFPNYNLNEKNYGM